MIPKVASWEEEKNPAKVHLAENGGARARGAETQAKDQFTVVTERQQLATLDGLECL